MPETPDVTGRASIDSDKEEKRAAKLQAKEQKRVDKAAARANREAELAQLEAETVGKLGGFRVFKDGTVQKETSSSPLMNSAVSAWRDKLSQAGLVADSGPSGRSAVMDVTFTDKRIRKPFARARSAMHVGLISTGNDHLGSVTLTITTRDWTETLTASLDERVAELMALRDLLLEVSDVAVSGSPGTSPEVAVASPVQSSDVAASLRELKGLHDEGLLTDEEFESRRQALVAQLPDGR